MVSVKVRDYATLKSYLAALYVQFVLRHAMPRDRMDYAVLVTHGSAAGEQEGD